jgi:hypothetical protein
VQNGEAVSKLAPPVSVFLIIKLKKLCRVSSMHGWKSFGKKHGRVTPFGRPSLDGAG